METTIQLQMSTLLCIAVVQTKCRGRDIALHRRRWLRGMVLTTRSGMLRPAV